MADATVERTGDPADLVVDTTDLAAAYLGAFRLSTLADAGRVEECTSGALGRADALFASARPLVRARCSERRPADAPRAGRPGLRARVPGSVSRRRDPSAPPTGRGSGGCRADRR